VTKDSTDLFTYDQKSGTYRSMKNFANAGTIQSLKITGPYTYRLYIDLFNNKAIDITINDGDPNNIAVKLKNWKGPKDNTTGGVKKLIKDFIDFKLTEEKNFLSQASDVIISAGGEVSKVLGDKYKN
jgi:hypothetical protein